jgi:N6-L-threonylcarbamoyladenine synthase
MRRNGRCRVDRRVGGSLVVPEVASRAHVERIVPVIAEALERAGIGLTDLDAVAVANEPGLSGSLLVGVMAAKTLALAAGVPLVAINHLQAHIYACRLASGGDVFPCIGLIVSGGHSHIYRCDSPTDFVPLGGTIDDAAGEAFDKVASLLGLPYPGGPAIGQAAAAGNPQAYDLPRPLLDDKSRLDFSFSGLKTAVRYRLLGTGKLDADRPPLSQRQVNDMAASFQEAVIDCLIGKTELAIAQTGYRTLCVGGGVAANRRLRERLTESAREHAYELHIPPLSLCTDNAVMGAIAVEHLRAGKTDSLALDILPGLQRLR